MINNKIKKNLKQIKIKRIKTKFNIKKMIGLIAILERMVWRLMRGERKERGG